MNSFYLNQQRQDTMEILQRLDLRPVIYIVSTSSEQVKLVVTAARNLECIPLTYDSLSSFFPYYDETAPGCVVLCLDQHDSHASSMIDRIVKRHASAQIIVVTKDWELEDIIKIIKHGATNVLAEPIECSRMVDALEEAIAQDRVARTRLSLSIPEAVIAQLTSDEASILSLLLQGRTTKEIGSELDLSVRTIHYRKNSMFTKLSVRNRSEAVEMVRTIRRGKPVLDDSNTIYPRAS